MHLTLAGGRLWRKLMSVCEHKGAPVEHIILFFPSGDLVSEVWVEICLLRSALGGVSIRVSVVHTRSMRYVFRRRARALCSRGNGVRSLWAFFLWEKAPLSVVPFSRENWGDHLPPAARVQPLLRQWRDWVRGDRRWSLRTSFEREEFFISRSTAAARVNCGRKIVLSVTSSDPAESALLAHGVL